MIPFVVNLFGTVLGRGGRSQWVACILAVLVADRGVGQDTNAPASPDAPATPMAEGAAAAPSEAPAKQWLVIESGPGSFEAVEAVSVEEPVPNVVMITDTSGKKKSTNKSKIKLKLPSAPDASEGLQLADVGAAIDQFDRALATMPGLGESLKAGREAWDARRTELQAMEDQKKKLAERVDAFVGAAIDENMQYSAEEVEKRIQEGEALAAEAPDRQADISAQIEKWRAKIAPPAPAMAPAEPEQPKAPAIAPESLKLADDYRLKVPESALKPNVVTATVIVILMSIMFFFYATMHGLGRLLRLKASAFFYLAIGLGGLGFYSSVWLLLLETPEDFTMLQKASAGDIGLVEPVVAFAQKYPHVEGDPSAFKEVQLQDGSINEFLKKRLEFVPRKPAAPLDVKRTAMWLDVREDGVFIYQELGMLGAPLLATLFVPVRIADDDIEVGEPMGRLGQVTMPKMLAAVFWREMKEGVGQSLEEAGITRSFGLNKVTEHIVHIALRMP